MEAYAGLVAAICCIGACYSDRVDSSLVREITVCLYAVMERDCNVSPVATSQAPFIIEKGEGKVGLEKLQALILTDILMTWNGTSEQRAVSQQTFSHIALIARSSDFLRVDNDSSSSSPLHQPNFDLSTFDTEAFDWRSWIEQEKRNRLMHMIFLNDTARGLYFNIDPLFDAFEICIPLPADDAAWEAESSEDCLQALNLVSMDAVRKINPNGSQRIKQPELNLALAALLLHPTQIQPGSTNLYGKFILIHAILAQIRRDRLEGGSPIPIELLTSLRGKDWLADTQLTSNVDDQKTPSQKTFGPALDKWKNDWDMDMAIQFPAGEFPNPGRRGFSRDGPHFYWLGKLLLDQPELFSPEMSAGQQFTLVVELLKKVTTHAESDAARRGEEMGSVNDITHDNVLSSPTLSLNQLFKPLGPEFQVS